MSPPPRVAGQPSEMDSPPRSDVARLSSPYCPTPAADATVDIALHIRGSSSRVTGQPPEIPFWFTSPHPPPDAAKPLSCQCPTKMLPFVVFSFSKPQCMVCPAAAYATPQCRGFHPRVSPNLPESATPPMLLPMLPV